MFSVACRTSRFKSSILSADFSRSRVTFSRRQFIPSIASCKAELNTTNMKNTYSQSAGRWDSSTVGHIYGPDLRNSSRTSQLPPRRCECTVSDEGPFDMKAILDDQAAKET